MFKKFLLTCLSLIFVVMVSSVGFAQPNYHSKAEMKLTELGINTPDKDATGVKFTPTQEQLADYHKKEGIPFNQTDKSQRGKVLKSMKLLKTETYYDKQGKKHIAKYYRPEYKNTPFGQKVKKFFANKKRGEMGQTNPRQKLVKTAAFVPEEGDIRIDISYGSLSTSDFFDTEKGYKTVLKDRDLEWTLQMINNVATSNKVYSLLIGQVLNYVDSGSQGSGDGYIRWRYAHKDGQVYEDGQWTNYYRTYQKEYYWFHEMNAYDSDGNIKATEFKTYYPSGYYLPIEWMPTSDVDDDNAIVEQTQINYFHGYITIDGYEGDYKLSDGDWEVQGQFWYLN